MTRLALIAGAALLAACSTTAAPSTVRVEVPVPVYCDPPDVPPPPALPIDTLPPKANVFEVTRALWASVELQEGYVARLRVAVDACRSRHP